MTTLSLSKMMAGESFKFHIQYQQTINIMMIKSILFSTALTLTVIVSNAQTIPNASFESWTNSGTYETPDGWATLNAMTSPASVYTATKGA
ncbi:MAG: hypothetical protein V4651_06095, partial [Bacteroidota bacterium]